MTDNGKYGLLVPRGDRAKLVEAMEQILQPEVRAQYSELGQQRTEVLSPLASAGALVDFLSKRLRVGN